MNTAPTPSRSTYVQSLHLFTIIIDQTTLKDDLSLIICQLTQSYIELLQSVTFNSISLDHVDVYKRQGQTAWRTPEVSLAHLTVQTLSLIHI